jgi:probable HAF family extracellular repeat protein
VLFVGVVPRGPFAAAPGPAYTMTDLATLGGAASEPRGIDERGQVVGAAELADGHAHAVLWSDGATADLGTLGGPDSIANGVNAAGQVVGVADTPDSTHAFLWERGGMRDLHPAGAISSAAYAINAAGQVVGVASGGPYRRLGQPIWWSGGATAPLLPLADQAAIVELAVNDAGQVVGTEVTGGFTLAGASWSGPAAAPQELPFAPFAINRSGQLVGAGSPDLATSGVGHPVLVQGGQQVDLDGQLPPGSPWRGQGGEAQAINDAGQVVGHETSAGAPPNRQHAFVWDHGRGTDLNDVTALPPGWALTDAVAVNDRGQIAALAQGPGFPQGRAVLLTPAAPARPCGFVLGFAALHAALPAVVGDCLDDEGHNPANGDALQHTTGGLLVWRKADNWTAFTDGYRTWVNGPNGLQERLNTQRFPWEANPDGLPLAR